MKSEPVITSAAVVGLLMSFLLMAVSLGWLKLDESQMGTIEKFAVAAIPLVLTLAGAWYARRQVTPIAAPKTKDGEPAVIVPASMVSPEIQAQIKGR